MTSLAARKCVQHPAREAVARCPVCGDDFCRECVVEHAGRILCAACLAREISAARPPRLSWPRVRTVLATTGAGVLLWVVFYFLGATLKAVPAEFHEGTVWQKRP